MVLVSGKGILAADESVSTMGKRFANISVENTEENRRAYRQLLFTSPEAMNTAISGVILFHETVYQKTEAGVSFIQVLQQRGTLNRCGFPIDLILISHVLY